MSKIVVSCCSQLVTPKGKSCEICLSFKPKIFSLRGTMAGMLEQHTYRCSLFPRFISLISIDTTLIIAYTEFLAMSVANQSLLINWHIYIDPYIYLT